MNRFSSHPDHENCLLYEGPRLRASPGHGGTGVFLNFVHRSAALRSPFVAAAIIVSDRESCNNPCNRAEYNDVHKKYFTLKAKRSRGFTPL
jgi:hypothetical protein